MSDEELDNLFRRCAESFDPPFDPEAWDAMEKKLDSVEGRNIWWQKLLFPLMIIVYTCSMVADTKLSHVLTTSAEIETTTSIDNITSIDKQPYSHSADDKNEQPIQQEQKLSSGKKSDQKAETTPGTPIENNLKEAQSKNKITTQQMKPSLRKVSDKNELGMHPVQQEETGQDSQPPIPSIIALGITPVSPLQEDVKEHVAVQAISGNVQDSVLFQAESSSEGSTKADSSLSRKLTKEKTFLRNVQIAVLVAPDWTTVKFKEPDGISANAGLLLSIPLTKKLSLVTGAVWANKVYSAYPKDYSPSSGYWNSYYLPESIDATCMVLDIPLNLQYQVHAWDKNIIAIQAGLSSYIMLKENYTYNYNSGYGRYSKSVKYANEYLHLFGVQNVSVSYARRISPALSVGVEPFIKVPLTGIGAGHVKLSSAGVFFKAGYTLQLKK
ncbi:hypothetical protein ACFS7Z_15715 [Pontibacter toksunensis]|uniref:Outer membrane protein beta-barrel domain-containing protein n=1 Tax=Pontibacter toksunensis TaxID=1332631 RepID=A0ABW6BXD7_9BACT